MKIARIDVRILIHTYSQSVQNLFEIINEDNELLAINKPAGLVCHPTKTDEYSSLISRVRLYLGKDSHPQLVNRLDRETSGVTIVAKSAVAARQLRKIWESREVEKQYLAIVHGHVQREHGTIEAPLGKDEASKVAVKDCVRADGAQALTEYWVEKRFQRAGYPSGFSLLRVRLHTGRKHQIRIHLAHIGHPIVGDKLYGGDEDLYLALVEDRLTDEQRQQLILPNQALHANRVKFDLNGTEMNFEAHPEEIFSKFVNGG
ncbi:MAG TPA: RNA pseudouridine synthase [Candidatus Udaeobacter sp.]|jgi:23S rRNA pseudouridine1911/1915/1917 synthase|nr:RNA pseudouridine synthase [Candidatus Udaeobacter sp.]